MNFDVEKKNAGNKIIIKSYENDNGYCWIMSNILLFNPTGVY